MGLIYKIMVFFFPLKKKSFAIYNLGLSVNSNPLYQTKTENEETHIERDCIQTLTQTWDHCPVHKIRAFSWTTRSESAAPLSFLSLSLSYSLSPNTFIFLSLTLSLLRCFFFS